MKLSNHAMALIWFGLGSAILLVVIALRWSSDDHVLFTGALLFVLFLTNILVGYRYYSRHSDFRLDERIKTLKKLIKGLKNRLTILKNKKMNLAQGIQLKSDTHVEDLITSKKSEIKTYEDTLNKLKIKTNEITNRSTNTKNRGYAAIRDSYNQGIQRKESH